MDAGKRVAKSSTAASITFFTSKMFSSSFIVAVTKTARCSLYQPRCVASSSAQPTCATSRTRTVRPAADKITVSPTSSAVVKAPVPLSVKRRAPAWTAPGGTSAPSARSASATAVSGNPSSASLPRSTATRISGSGTPQIAVSQTPGIRSRTSFRSSATRFISRKGIVSLTSAICTMFVRRVPTRSTTTLCIPGGSVDRTAFTSRISSSYFSSGSVLQSNSTVTTENPSTLIERSCFRSSMPLIASSMGSVTNVSISPGSAPGRTEFTMKIGMGKVGSS